MGRLCHCVAIVWVILVSTSSLASSATTNAPPTTTTTTPKPPANVNGVHIDGRNETSLTLRWNKVNGSTNYNYSLSYNGKEEIISGSGEGVEVSYTLFSLIPGTEYKFTLYTVFNDIKSSGYNFSGVTTPANVNGVHIDGRNETSLTLRWHKVNNSTNYNYILSYNGKEEIISGSGEGVEVSYTLFSLIPGTEYKFTLYTVFNDIKSSGYKFSGVTTPANVNGVHIDGRNETSLTLRWDKVNGSTNYNYSLSYNGKEEIISKSGEGVEVSYSVASLIPGTEYKFTLYTVFNDIKSSGYKFSGVTTPDSVDRVHIDGRNETSLTLRWNKVNNSTNYNYILSYNGKEELISGSGEGVEVSYTLFSLIPGTEYKFTLYTVFNDIKSSGYNFSGVTTPSSVTNVSVLKRNETSLTLQWDTVNNNSNYYYRLSYNGVEENITVSEKSLIVTHTVPSLTSGTEYTFTLYTVFKEIQSSGYNFSAVTTPSSVTDVSVLKRNETSLTLQWDTVNNNSNYYYRLSYNGVEENITVSEKRLIVTHTVPSLTSGTEYTFTLYTVFKEIQSSGYNFSGVTTPSAVSSVSVKDRSETSLTLQWHKVNNNSDYDYLLNYSKGNISIKGSKEEFIVTGVSNLTPGTKYMFTLYAVFKGVNSKANTFSEVTSPSNVNAIAVNDRNETSLTLEWDKVNNDSKYIYTLSYNGTTVNIPTGFKAVLSKVTYTVTSLTPGTNYNFTLCTVFENVKSRGYNLISYTIPGRVTGLRCEYSSGGYALLLTWDPPTGGRTSVLVNIGSKSFNQSDESLSIGGLMPAQWYTLKVISLSGPWKSESVSKTCQTDPRGVISGILVFVLLAILIILLGFFIWKRKEGLSRLHKSKSSETRACEESSKPIPLSRFPEHFSSMSRDDNRGFREEYQDLSAVGNNQSRTAAEHPDNKSKNRFTNVLAYDVSRVKLSEQNGETSDYINANYMPGYGGNNKQYIASQGPLPATINDFWRMVWEQKSTAIVMLTRCIEGGRTKCEQYWPLDYTPCTYGHLHVTVQSEQKQSSWTLREFLVRNISTGKERRVTHFHFTAWPDHNVPAGTEELMEFRGIVRQHIESASLTGPTVVHCSAGVGRTGTLIALDILLQQMEKEGAVGVYDSVHRMRLRRPLMVQTESQYMFLHQCIMDSLQPKEDSTTDPIYENADMIYSNGMALRQYKAADQQI